MIKMKSRYSFEDHGTDRQTDEIDFGMFSQRPFKWYDMPIKAEN